MSVKYILSNEIIFDAKPDAVPYNYRISYKIAQLCLIISMCCRGGCSLIKLHMVSISLFSKRDIMQLIELSNDSISNYPVIRFDPAVNRAIKFAISDGLIFQQQNGLFRLSKKGNKFVTLIKKDIALMLSEKSNLSELSYKLTEQKINALTSSWRY